MTAKSWTILVVVALVGTLAWMFTVQNMGREVLLSLEIPFVVARVLEKPIALPWLLWAAFGIGLILGAGAGLFRVRGAAQRVRELEQRLARASVQQASDDWS